MVGWLSDFGVNVAAGLFLIGVGYLAAQVRRWLKARATKRAVREFFGLPGRILIVHSAIFDADEQAWNYPATDMKAVRRLAQLFESVGLHEGVDFTVAADRQVVLDDQLWQQSLVLLCGPKRNAVFKNVAPQQATLRYTMMLSDDGEFNVLTDHLVGHRLQSARQTGDEVDLHGHDWGLVSSFRSARAPTRRIVLLAGIHGTGTVGAAEYVSDLGHLRKLLNRREAGAVSAAVRVGYDGDRDTPTRIDLT